MLSIRESILYLTRELGLLLAEIWREAHWSHDDDGHTRVFHENTGYCENDLHMDALTAFTLMDFAAAYPDRESFERLMEFKWSMPFKGERRAVAPLVAYRLKRKNAPEHERDHLRDFVWKRAWRGEWRLKQKLRNSRFMRKSLVSHEVVPLQSHKGGAARRIEDEPIVVTQVCDGVEQVAQLTRDTDGNLLLILERRMAPPPKKP